MISRAVFWRNKLTCINRFPVHTIQSRDNAWFEENRKIYGKPDGAHGIEGVICEMSIKFVLLLLSLHLRVYIGNKLNKMSFERFPSFNPRPYLPICVAPTASHTRHEMTLLKRQPDTHLAPFHLRRTHSSLFFSWRRKCQIFLSWFDVWHLLCENLVQISEESQFFHLWSFVKFQLEHRNVELSEGSGRIRGEAKMLRKMQHCPWKIHS